MNRRAQRVANLIRQTVGQLLLTKLSDPRFDPARTSITRVKVTEDLLTATIFVSVMADAREQNKILRALRHAAGHIQELMMRQIRLRHTPRIEFVLDEKFKKTLQTLVIIQQVSQEIRDKEQRQADQYNQHPNAGQTPRTPVR